MPKRIAIKLDAITDPNGALDVDALAEALAGQDAVWVGPGSPWQPPFQRGTGTFAVHEGLSVNTDDPDDINRALAIAIRWSLPFYPTVDQIRRDLAGKNLADATPLYQSSHADVLLAVAQGKDYQP